MLAHVFLLFMFVASNALAQDVRDPTAPPFSPVKVETKKVEPPPRPYILEMIVVTSEDRYVIIDGEILHIGDFLGSWKVQDINDYSVTMVSKLGTKRLSLSSDVIIPIETIEG